MLPLSSFGHFWTGEKKNGQDGDNVLGQKIGRPFFSPVQFFYVKIFYAKKKTHLKKYFKLKRFLREKTFLRQKLFYAQKISGRNIALLINELKKTRFQ